MRKTPYIHGFVVAIGPETGPNYFTGSSYSAFLDEARVFRTPQGAMSASRIWQRADYNENPLPQSWWKARRAVPVSLRLGEATSENGV
jgi:hypothetical protein